MRTHGVRLAIPIIQKAMWVVDWLKLEWFWVWVWSLPSVRHDIVMYSLEYADDDHLADAKDEGR